MKTFVNFFSGIACVALVVSVLSLNQVYAQTAEYHSNPGIGCMPANLGQATAFTASWDHRRAFNPNALGSGRNYYLTCPVVFSQTPGDYSTSDDDMYVYVHKEDTAADQVTCTAYLYSNYDPSSTSAYKNRLVNTVTGTTTGADATERLILTNLVPADDGFLWNLSGVRDYTVVLCKMTPQTGINSLHYDYDGI